MAKFYVIDSKVLEKVIKALENHQFSPAGENDVCEFNNDDVISALNKLRKEMADQ